MLEVPVLLIVFNRPEITQKVFDKIRSARPKKLYVSADGPRQNKNGEEELCNEVKRLVQIIDWPCECSYLFNDRNSGAEVTVSSAISWVLKNEEFVIVLEDDIIAPESFFLFMQEMLLKYRNEPKIAMVSGSNFTPINLYMKEDYLFGIYGHTGGGWGTWKRAWEKFDLYINDFDAHLKTDFLNRVFNNKLEVSYYKQLVKRMKKIGAGSNTWDLCWYYIRLVNGLLTVIPRVNLTSNIGAFGLHARGATENHFRRYDEDFIVVKHPDRIQRNLAYDKYHFENYIIKDSPFFLRVIWKAKRILSLK